MISLSIQSIWRLTMASASDWFMGERWIVTTSGMGRSMIEAR